MSAFFLLFSAIVLMLICTRVAAWWVIQQVHMGDSAANVLPQTRANENVSQKNTNTVVCLPQHRVYAASGTDAHPWTRHRRGTMAACSHAAFNMPLADMFPVYSLFGEAEITTFATCRWHLAGGLNPAKKANRQDVRMCSQTKKRASLPEHHYNFSPCFFSGCQRLQTSVPENKEPPHTHTLMQTHTPLLPKIISHTLSIIFWLVPITPIQFSSSQRCVTEYLPNWKHFSSRFLLIPPWIYLYPDSTQLSSNPEL